MEQACTLILSYKDMHLVANKKSGMKVAKPWQKLKTKKYKGGIVTFFLIWLYYFFSNRIVMTSHERWNTKGCSLKVNVENDNEKVWNINYSPSLKEYNSGLYYLAKRVREVKWDSIRLSQMTLDDWNKITVI